MERPSYAIAYIPPLGSTQLPASQYQVLFPQDERVGCHANHSRSSNTRTGVKNAWKGASSTLHTYEYMAQCIIESADGFTGNYLFSGNPAEIFIVPQELPGFKI